MNIIALADIHGEVSRVRAFVSQKPSADLILLVGDITHFRGEKEAAEILDLLKQTRIPLLAVSGNCDFSEVDDFLIREGIGIHGRWVTRGGITFVGLGGSLLWLGQTPNELPEEAYETFLSRLAPELPSNQPVILVSHQPPFGTDTDLASNGKHTGSRSIRKFIEQYKPLICFTGHIHEAVGIDRISPTRIINSGPFFNGLYGSAEVTDTLESLTIKNIVNNKPKR